MEATAHLSHRVRDPCYHVVIALPAEDRPTATQLEQSADSVLDGLALSAHQAILVAHNDTPHPHVHMMINRVHPETGKAWERWRDRYSIERILRDQERALHFREVPGRLSYREQGRPLGPVRDVASHRPLGAKALTLLERARAAVRDLRRATRWGELDTVLAGAGLILERQGRGLLLSDGQSRIPTARVHADLALPALERRFPEGYPEPLPAPEIQGVVAQLQSLARTRELRAVVMSAQTAVYWAEARAHSAPSAPSATSKQELGELRGILADVEHALAAHMRESAEAVELEHAVGVTMARMRPDELRQLARLVEPPHLVLAMTLRDTIREVLRADRANDRRGMEAI